MARSQTGNGKLLAALAIGAAVVGVNFMRNRKTLPRLSDELGNMARQGVDNVRRDSSERVREATAGAEDLKGKSFWSATGLVLASAIISACAEEAKEQSERKAEKAHKPSPEKMDPAHKPGVKVYRPEPLPTAKWVSRLRRVEDSNGDYMVVESGHAGGIGQYTFGNKGTGLVAYGAYQSTSRSGSTVFEIVDLRTQLGAAPKLSRSEFDVARIAMLFRAYMDLAAPRHGREIIVVDSRPE